MFWHALALNTSILRAYVPPHNKSTHVYLCVVCTLNTMIARIDSFQRKCEQFIKATLLLDFLFRASAIVTAISLPPTANGISCPSFRNDVIHERRGPGHPSKYQYSAGAYITSNTLSSVLPNTDKCQQRQRRVGVVVKISK